MQLSLSRLLRTHSSGISYKYLRKGNPAKSWILASGYASISKDPSHFIFVHYLYDDDALIISL